MPKPQASGVGSDVGTPGRVSIAEGAADPTSRGIGLQVIPPRDSSGLIDSNHPGTRQGPEIRDIGVAEGRSTGWDQIDLHLRNGFAFDDEADGAGGGADTVDSGWVESTDLIPAVGLDSNTGGIRIVAGVAAEAVEGAITAGGFENAGKSAIEIPEAVQRVLRNRIRPFCPD